MYYHHILFESNYHFLFSYSTFNKFQVSEGMLREQMNLILNMDFDENNFDKIIMEKIIPLIKEKKEKFVINKKNE